MYFDRKVNKSAKFLIMQFEQVTDSKIEAEIIPFIVSESQMLVNNPDDPNDEENFVDDLNGYFLQAFIWDSSSKLQISTSKSVSPN